MVIDDDTEGYVAYYDVQDEDDDALPRFFAVWTTKKLMEIFHQDDATHLFMWQGFYLNINIFSDPRVFLVYALSETRLRVRH